MDEDNLRELALAHWLNLVYGGQDHSEYTQSMRIIRQALEHVPDNVKYKPASLY